MASDDTLDCFPHQVDEGDPLFAPPSREELFGKWRQDDVTEEIERIYLVRESAAESEIEGDRLRSEIEGDRLRSRSPRRYVGRVASHASAHRCLPSPPPPSPQTHRPVIHRHLPPLPLAQCKGATAATRHASPPPIIHHLPTVTITVKPKRG